MLKNPANNRPISPLRRFKSQAGMVLGVVTLVALVYAIWHDASLFRGIEGRLLDWRFQLRGEQQPGPETVIVEIDDASVAALGGWPLPRESLAAMVAALSADGAKVIAIDLLLVDAARTRGRRSISSDRELATALSRAGNVILPFAFTFDTAEANYRQVPGEIGEVAYKVVRRSAAQGAGLGLGDEPRPTGLLAPAKRFLRPSFPAQVNVFLEPDGALRQANPALSFGERYFPSLPVEALRMYLDQPRSGVALHLGEGISIGDLFVPTDSDLRLPVNYYGPEGQFKHYVLTDVLEGRLPPGTFTGRIVMVGATALGVGDAFSTPFSQRLPGVEHFATLVDNMLHDRVLRRGDWTFALDLLIIFACGLASLILLPIRAPLVGVGVSLALVFGTLAVNLFAFSLAGLWLNLTFPLIAIVLSIAILAVGSHLAAHRDRRVAEGERAELARFVSPLATSQLSQEVRTDPEGQGHHATVVFADLKGFTSLSENLSPGETMTVLRRFHRAVERAVLSNSGTIDKFVGDGAMAVFGVPSSDPAAAVNALRAVRQLIAEVEALNDELDRQRLPSLDVRAGLHFGPVTLGVLGGNRQSQVTVTGDTVNIASRLESLTRNENAKIIASDAVIESARAMGGDAAVQGFRELPMQTIRGRRRPLGVWALQEPQRSGGAQSRLVGPVN